MSREKIPSPNRRFSLVIRDEHDVKLRKIALRARDISGENCSVAGVLDHVIAELDIEQTAAEISTKVKP